MSQLLKRIIVAQESSVVLSDLGKGFHIKKGETVDLLNRTINNQTVVRFTLEEICRSRALDSALKSGQIRLYDENYEELSSIAGESGERSTNLATLKDLDKTMLSGTRLLVDYNDASTSISPLQIEADTWTDIPNNGAGAYSNTQFLPSSFGSLLDTDTGYLDFSSLSIGDGVLVRSDFKIIPSINDCYLRLRLGFGSGFGVFYLTKQISSLSNGAGVEYPVEELIYFYIGSEDIKNSPVKIQVNASAPSTLVNSGVAITVLGAPV